MDQDTFKNNLKSLKESILDEQKLVTYMSLSKELCVHVNEAKKLLNHVVQDIRKSAPKTDVNVCYVISGLSKNNSACTTVCSESHIEALRQTLNIVFYEHIYCVSRGVQAADNVALAAVNKFEDFLLCTGLIKANSCIKRPVDEIESLKCRSSHGITVDTKINNETTKNVIEKKKELNKNSHENGKQVQVKTDPALKSKTPSPKKDIFANNKTSVTKNGTKPAVKGIAGFFNKANGDNNKAKPAKIKEEKKDNELEAKIEHDNIKVEMVNTSKDISSITAKAEPVNKSKENNRDEGKSNKNSLKQIKKNAKVDKKRKRVLHVSDSESETETNDLFSNDDSNMVVDQESEDEIPPTPAINTVKITSGIINPKKKRKIVDKTYTDEDGYILTKKEEVYESCSDDEVETEAKIKQEKENIDQVIQVKTEISPKENGKIKKKKISPPQKGKQQMLTSFFKKV